MKKSQLIFTKYSPLMAVDASIEDSNGQLLKTPRVSSLCRCGQSKMKPYCDGSHGPAGFCGNRENNQRPPIQEFAGKQLTIVYDQYLCNGAGFCTELPAVFGTHEKPIFEPDAAPLQTIIATIKKCPTGALTYKIADVHYQNFFDATKVIIEKNGPYHCQGDHTIIDDQESDQVLPKCDHCTLCRCGASTKHPLCDGSHESNGFED